MWTPIVLMCTMALTECNTYGGPVFRTEASCQRAIEITGLPQLREIYPSKVLIKTKCVNWAKTTDI